MNFPSTSRVGTCFMGFYQKESKKEITKTRAIRTETKKNQLRVSLAILVALQQVDSLQEKSTQNRD
jgi:hypothetical protein